MPPARTTSPFGTGSESGTALDSSSSPVSREYSCRRRTSTPCTKLDASCSSCSKRQSCSRVTIGRDASRSTPAASTKATKAPSKADPPDSMLGSCSPNPPLASMESFLRTQRRFRCTSPRHHVRHVSQFAQQQPFLHDDRVHELEHLRVELDDLP